MSLPGKTAADQARGGAAARLVVHIRRFLPLYVLGTVWVVMVALFPTVERGGNGQIRATGGAPQAVPSGQRPAGTGGQAIPTQPGARPAGPTASTTVGGTPVGGVVVPGGTVGGGSAGGGASGPSGTGATASAPTPGASGGIEASGPTAGGDEGSGGGGGGTPLDPSVAPPAQEGLTRGGDICGPGVRQIPFSEYAAPCRPAWQGDNGGASWRGVTGDTIRMAVRYYSDAGGPNQQVVDSFLASAGFGSPDDRRFTRDTFIAYLNDHMELYGRKVVLERYDGRGVSTEEAQSRGQESACADATALAEERKVFAVIHDQWAHLSQPFAECGAERGLMMPLAAPYYPETYYKRWHPYAWGTLMECERIAHQVAEYMGKRLVGRPAKWAKDAAYKTQTRVFGTYVPNNDGYQSCVNIYEKEFKEIYGGEVKHRYNYALDVSQFATEAARAVPQFKAAGVTTFTQACDTYSTLFLTQQARAQDWGPEWLIIGVALQDTENFARLWDQDRVSGHLFGMSQLGNNSKLYSKDGEAYKAFKLQEPDREPPGDAHGNWFWILHFFNMLQAAGPNLTPDNMAAGLQGLPPGGGLSVAYGTWYFGDDHTAIDDSREIYYDAQGKDYKGASPAYVETYAGQRFKDGEWPAEEPPVYPAG